eukprot:4034761-Amphidinium_carterae.1
MTEQRGETREEDIAQDETDTIWNFLKSVDEVMDERLCAAAKAKLVELGFSSPLQLEGVTATDVDECRITSIPLRAFLKR